MTGANMLVFCGGVYVGLLLSAAIYLVWAEE